MTTAYLKDRMACLVEEIKAHAHRYAVLHAPTISDEEYDQLMRELIDLESQHPEWVHPDSPAQHVASDLTDQSVRVPHKRPMLSLQNAFTLSEIEEFDGRIRDTLRRKKVAYVCELKIDGVALSLHYEEGVLVRALTRGDGTTGEDVTEQVRRIADIRPRLLDSKLTCEIRGEAFYDRATFEKLNRQRHQEGEPDFASGRSAVAGTLKLKDMALFNARQPIRFVAYWFWAEDPKCQPRNHWFALHDMRDLGFHIDGKSFPISSGKSRRATLREMEIYIESREKERWSLPYEIDGVVIKAGRINDQRALGETTKHPRWAIAYKFTGRPIKTTVEGVAFQVGRTGHVTPVAKFSPVSFGGTTISQATLHNVEEFRKKDLHIGDTVRVELSGGIIPQIVSVEKHQRVSGAMPFPVPTHCPICDALLFHAHTSLWCVNDHCPEKIKSRLLHFASRGAMDIRGLGKKLIGKLVDRGIVKTFADLYELDMDTLKNIDRMGERSAGKIVLAIETSRYRPLENVLFALGIPQVGLRTAHLLVKHFPHIEQLEDATCEELAAMPDIGPVIAENVDAYFANATHVEEINPLRHVLLALNPYRIRRKK